MLGCMQEDFREVEPGESIRDERYLIAGSVSSHRQSRGLDGCRPPFLLFRLINKIVPSLKVADKEVS